MKQKTVMLVRPIGLDPTFWGLVALLGAVDAIWARFSNIEFDLSSFLPLILCSMTLATIAWLYTARRPCPRIANFATCAVALLYYTNGIAILTYLITATDRPLIDQSLVAADRFLGLDWPVIDTWLRSHPWLFISMSVAYASPLGQIGLLLIIFHTRDKIQRLRELVWLFSGTLLITTIISGIFPAAGAFATFGTHLDEPYLQQFLALRNGTLGAFDLTKVEGIVQFPSFHTTLAVIFAWEARGLGKATPLFVLLNVAMLLSTPSCGGHHFADLWGGGIVAVAAILALRFRWSIRLLPFRRIRRKTKTNSPQCAITLPSHEVY